jgi:hypothetical protein
MSSLRPRTINGVQGQFIIYNLRETSDKSIAAASFDLAMR